MREKVMVLGFVVAYIGIFTVALVPSVLDGSAPVYAPVVLFLMLLNPWLLGITYGRATGQISHKNIFLIIMVFITGITIGALVI